MNNIAFIGGGSFGTALAVLLANKGNNIKIYDLDKSVVNNINVDRKNDKYMKGIKIPNNIYAYTNIEDAINGADYIVFAVPSHVIRNLSKSLVGKIKKDIPIINIAKGIEKGTNKRLSEIIEEELGNPVVVLSGPSHAEEVVLNMPTTVVVSSKNMDYAREVQELFMTNEFRVYTNEDIIGVEIGGAIKNVIALAAGICDGIGYGDNTKAALITRGMAEIVRVGIKMGGNSETFLGLTGTGDLIVTCGSLHSRNRRAGFLLGKGYTIEEAIEEIGMIVEGIKACESFYNLKERIDVEMPIIDVVYKVIFENLNPKEGVQLLLSRDKKCEMNF
ncbi:NAD(P)H-dependent glycerol-3-phosphate dehydrogenase [Clostridium baratii]|uniref:NAD(P)H-dependent glycerol-3-phosphate dehydrogenase n=1 Tax=Clostridium baratii TaxID=1561 RepID=UPI0030D200AB